MEHSEAFQYLEANKGLINRIRTEFDLLLDASGQQTYSFIRKPPTSTLLDIESYEDFEELPEETQANLLVIADNKLDYAAGIAGPTLANEPQTSELKFMPFKTTDGEQVVASRVTTTFHKYDNAKMTVYTFVVTDANGMTTHFNTVFWEDTAQGVEHSITVSDRDLFRKVQEYLNDDFEEIRQAIATNKIASCFDHLRYKHRQSENAFEIDDVLTELETKLKQSIEVYATESALGLQRPSSEKLEAILYDLTQLRAA